MWLMFAWLLRLWLHVMHWIEHRIQLALNAQGFDCDSVALFWLGISLSHITSTNYKQTQQQPRVVVSTLMFAMSWRRGFVLEVDGRVKAWVGQQAAIWVMKRFTFQLTELRVGLARDAAAAFKQQELVACVIESVRVVGAAARPGLSVGLELNRAVLLIGGHPITTQPFSAEVNVQRLTNQEITVHVSCSKLAVRVTRAELHSVLQQQKQSPGRRRRRSAQDLWQLARAGVRLQLHAHHRKLRQPHLDALIANRLASESFEGFLAQATADLAQGKIVRRPSSPPTGIVPPPPSSIALSTMTGGRRLAVECSAVDVSFAVEAAMTTSLNLSPCQLTVGVGPSVVVFALDHALLVLPRQTELSVREVQAKLGTGATATAVVSVQRVQLLSEKVELVDGGAVSVALTGDGKASIDLGRWSVSEEWESFGQAYEGVRDMQEVLSSSSSAPTKQEEEALTTSRSSGIVPVVDDDQATISVPSSSSSNQMITVLLQSLHLQGQEADFAIARLECVVDNGRRVALTVERWGKAATTTRTRPAVDLRAELPSSTGRPASVELVCTGAEFSVHLPLLGFLAEFRGPPPPPPPPSPPSATLPPPPRTSFLPPLPLHTCSIRLDECTLSLGKHIAAKTSCEFTSRSGGDSGTEIALRSSVLQLFLLTSSILSDDDDDGEGLAVDIPPIALVVEEGSSASAVSLVSTDQIKVRVGAVVRPVAYLAVLQQQLFPYPAPPPPPLSIQFAYDASFFPDVRIALGGAVIKLAGGGGEAKWGGLEAALESTSRCTFSASAAVQRLAVVLAGEEEEEEAGASSPFLTVRATFDGEEEEDDGDGLLDVKLDLNGGALFVSRDVILAATELQRTIGEALPPPPPPPPINTTAALPPPFLPPPPPPLFPCATRVTVALHQPLVAGLLALEFGVSELSLQAFVPSSSSSSPSSTRKHNADVTCSVYAKTSQASILKPLTLAARRHGSEIAVSVEDELHVELDVFFFSQIALVASALPSQAGGDKPDEEAPVPALPPPPPPPATAAVEEAPIELTLDFARGASFSVLKRIPGGDYVTMLLVEASEIKLRYVAATARRRRSSRSNGGGGGGEALIHLGLSATALGDQLVDPFHVKIAATLLPGQALLPQTTVELELLDDFTVNMSQQALFALSWVQRRLADGGDDKDDDKHGNSIAALTESGRAFLVSNHSSDVLVYRVVERDSVSLPSSNNGNSSKSSRRRTTPSMDDDYEDESELFFTGWFRHFRQNSASWERVFVRVNPLVAVVFASNKTRVPLEVIHLLSARVGLDGDLDDPASSNPRKRAPRVVRAFQIIVPPPPGAAAAAETTPRTRHRFMAPSLQLKLDLLLFLKRCQRSVRSATCAASLPHVLGQYDIGGGDAAPAQHVRIGQRDVFATLSDGVVSFFDRESAKPSSLTNYCDLYTALAVTRPNAHSISLEFPRSAVVMDFATRDGGDAAAAALRKWESSLAETMVILQQIRNTFVGQRKVPCFSTTFPAHGRLEVGQTFKVFGHSKAVLLGVARKKGEGEEEMFRAEVFVTRDAQVAADAAAAGSSLTASIEFGDLVSVKNTLLVRNDVVLSPSEGEEDGAASLQLSRHRMRAAGGGEDGARLLLGYVVTNRTGERRDFSWTVGGPDAPDSAVSKLSLAPDQPRCFFLQHELNSHEVAFMCTNSSSTSTSGLAVEWIEAEPAEEEEEEEGQQQHAWKRGEVVSVSGRFHARGHVTLLRVHGDELLLPFNNSTASGGQVKEEEEDRETLSRWGRLAALKSPSSSSGGGGASEYVLVNAVLVENDLPWDVQVNNQLVRSTSSSSDLFLLPMSVAPGVLDEHRIVLELATTTMAAGEPAQQRVEFVSPAANTVLERPVHWSGGGGGVTSSALVKLCLGKERVSSSSGTGDDDDDDDDEASQQPLGGSATPPTEPSSSSSANRVFFFKYPICIRLTCTARVDNLSGLDLLVRVVGGGGTGGGGSFKLASGSPAVTFAAHVDSVQLAVASSTADAAAAAAYSSPFPLLVGSNGVIELVAGGGGVYKLAIAIQPGNHVTIHAFYTLVNQCPFDVECQQQQQPEGDDDAGRLVLCAGSAPLAYHPNIILRAPPRLGRHNSSAASAQHAAHGDDEPGMRLRARPTRREQGVQEEAGGFSLPFRLDVAVDTLLVAAPSTAVGQQYTACTARNSAFVEQQQRPAAGDKGDVVNNADADAADDDGSSGVFAVSVSFAQHPRLEITFVTKERVRGTAGNRFLVCNTALLAQATVALVEEAELSSGAPPLPLIVQCGDVVDDYVFHNSSESKVWIVCLLSTRERVRVDMGIVGVPSAAVADAAGAERWLWTSVAGGGVAMRLEERPLGRALVVEDYAPPPMPLTEEEEASGGFTSSSDAQRQSVAHARDDDDDAEEEEEEEKEEGE